VKGVSNVTVVSPFPSGETIPLRLFAATVQNTFVSPEKRMESGDYEVCLNFWNEL
jgi:hypothetical protein